MKNIILNDLRGIMPDSKVDQLYLKQYLLYRAFFEKYIIEKIHLKKYDKQINDSDLNFIKIEEKDMDIYQYLSSDELNFFYIRNNFFIERLSESEKKFLEEKMKEKELYIDGEIIDFLEKTYPRIIFEDTGNDGKIYTTFYGPKTSKYMANNNSLIIGFRYNDYYSEGISELKWAENRSKQLMLVQSIINAIKFKEKDKTNIEVLHYNEFSIQNKISKNKEEER